MDAYRFVKSVSEILFFILLVLLTVKPFGNYIYKTISNKRTFLSGIFRPLEKFIYRLSGIRDFNEQDWLKYTLSLILFNAAGFVFLYLLQLTQKWLPLNPQQLGNVTPDLAFNTAAAFVTNTNWQAYTPETTMSYFTQMTGLAVQNFLSASTGICVTLALIRGFIKRNSNKIGNFWLDLTRTTLYVLLPFAFIITVIFIFEGIPQNFSHYAEIQTLEGTTQTIPQGPVASQESIKELGTNGGGFFNANSAHPYENPTPFTNFIELLLIAAIPAGLTYTFGRMVGNKKQGWALLSAMLFLLIAGIIIVNFSEHSNNPNLNKEYSGKIDMDSSYHGAAGNLEGKETRFGITESAIFSTLTTATSTGAVNNMHSSLYPLSQLVLLFNMQLGEILLGGIGSGLFSMILFAIITVFICGLMVGRTPEYLGKKIGPNEIRLTVLAVLISSALMLIFTGIASVLDITKTSVGNPGPHGFSEILYAYTSAAANNGSALASFNANAPYWNYTIGFVMIIGRFFPMIFTLKLAGSLSAKKYTSPSTGTLPTTGLTFILLLIGVIIIVGGLTFFPALSLGPIIEHIMLFTGKLF